MWQQTRAGISAAMLVFLCVLLISCGGGSAATPATSNVPPSAAQPGAAAPQQTFVVLLVEENQAFEDVIGSPAMPYFNSLAQQGSLATQYYADSHPSLSDYFELTTGAMQTLDNNFQGPVSSDNLARELIAAGKTWKTYAEDLPSPGYLGGDVGHYFKHHDPFAYFSDVISAPAQAANIVPFTQFSSDLAAGALPAFSLVVPDALDDGHDCPNVTPCVVTDELSQIDNWLKSNIAPLISNAQFQRSGLLLIAFDESKISDWRNGGGRIPFVAVGPKARAGAQSSTLYRHENTLRTICDELSLSACPGTAASAQPESDLVR